MPPQILAAWITPTARTKLKAIYTYSCNKWGKSTAQRYMHALEETITSVAESTKHTKINPDFSIRFPYCIFKQHYIFFEYQNDKLTVVTIFHTMQSIKERLAEEAPGLQQEINNLD